MSLKDLPDSRLKELQSRQTPFQKKAKTLSEKDEKQLSLTGCLGSHCPTALKTRIVSAGKIFALREELKHRNLCFDSFDFTETENGNTIAAYRQKT